MYIGSPKNAIHSFTMRNLVIFGDSSFAERISIYIKEEKLDKLVAFTLDEERITRTTIDDVPVVPLHELNGRLGKDSFEIILAIGYTRMNELRKDIYNKCINAGYKVGTYVSSKAMVYASEIGEGSIVLPNVIIGPRCKIGKCVFFESSSTLSHDDVLGDFNFISTNVVMGGNAIVGDHCFIGLHSTIKNSVTLPNYTFIGSGSNVITSPPPQQLTACLSEIRQEN